MKISVLVVDDEQKTVDFLREALERSDYVVDSAASGEEALEILAMKPIDIMVSDVKMKEVSGIDLLEKAALIQPELLTIMVTAFGEVDIAVKAMKLGARDFLEKPIKLEKLEAVVDNAAEVVRLRHENRRLKKDVDDRYHDIVGKSSRMKELYETIETTARARSTVLITGESGTGKELVARAIHKSSDRADRMLVRVNCPALPKDLVEAELFGYEKGAFTGADRQRKGHFEMAHGSTLLLDEISEIPLGMQAKLLRVLQEKEIVRLGTTAPIKVDVRVIATSNRNLKEAIARGDFRDDLFYRINVIPIEIIPLRDRLEDVPLLVRYFIDKYNQENDRHIVDTEESVLSLFMKYHWPGNVRELSNLIERAVVSTRSERLTTADFPSELALGKYADDAVRLESGMTLAEGEKILILKTLKKFKGNKTRAAEALQITTRTIRNKLAEYDIKSNG